MNLSPLLRPLVLLASVLLVSFTPPAETTNYRCMIQLTNYTGEGAYVVVSLLDAAGEYVQTLYVQGEDDEWYNEISAWWKFHGRRRANLDAITGPTVGGGERTVSLLKIPSDKIGAGYQLRFETAVEDQEYYEAEIQFELTQENLQKQMEGRGFIRYVRMVPQ